MLHPQVVVFEKDGRLTAHLQPLVQAERWALREVRRSETLKKWLTQPIPTIFVLKLGQPPEAELELVRWVSDALTHVQTVCVGDWDHSEAIAGLCWGLGSAFSLFPPLSRDLLPDIVTGLMRRAVKDIQPPVARPTPEVE